MEEDRTSFSILIGSDPGKISVGTLQSRWVDNIRIDLKEIGVSKRSCFDLAEDRDNSRTVVNAELNIWVLMCMKLVITSQLISRLL